MRRAGVALAVALALAPAAGCDRGAGDGQASSGPNVVVIMTDDQRVDELAVMPAVRRLIGRRGTTFTRAYVSFPLCCPSRATYLTGQYAHNHRVLDNREPLGSVSRLDADETLPVWLQRAGYRTAHIGKYLNGYGAVTDPLDVPPGWDDWQATVDPSTYYYRGYTLNVNGSLVRPRRHQTDEVTRRALAFVRAAAPGEQPFFLDVAYLAPHDDRLGGRCVDSAKPLPRHAGRFELATVPRRGSFDERNVRDKPRFIRALPRLGRDGLAYVTRQYRCRRESLLGVDEGVAQILGELRRRGELRRTLIVFTSDNGYFLGEHRLPDDKINPYEEAARVPLLIRGPGVPAGQTVRELVANIDLAPTILDAAGAEAGLEPDGRSLLPVARRGRGDPRRAILLENGARAFEARFSRYAGVRYRNLVYLEYTDGERELYDLGKDPAQLYDRSRTARYRHRRAALAALLLALRDCKGRDCWLSRARQ